MEKRYLWMAVVAVIAGFLGGFLLANGLNRSELAQLRSENERLKGGSASAGANSQAPLTVEEVRQKIAEADQNPQNFQFQKNLGLALYRYAAMQQNSELLLDAIRILERAHQLDEADYDVTVGLGNAHFDIGYFTKNNERLARSRVFYQKALDRKPNDADVVVDVALSYYLEEPPADAKAIEEFKKAIQIDPKHEKAYNFLIQTYIRTGNVQEAEAALAALRKANSASEAIPDLETAIGRARSGQS